MNRTLKLYGILLIIVLLMMGLMEISKKEVTDWRKNYDPNETSPFGLYIFDHEAPGLFGKGFTKTEISPYAYYQQHKNIRQQNILVINSEIDKQSWKSLLKQVNNGSDLMLITTDIDGETLRELDLAPLRVTSYEDSVSLKLRNPLYKKDSLMMDKLPNRMGFRFINKKSQLLGISVGKDEGAVSANFIRYPYGKGNILIHTEPLFVTNYYMLRKGNTRYIQDVFSYLPQRPTVWFTDTSEVVSASIMRFILSRPALRGAWWIFLFGLLTFVIFNAKRKQRIVPILSPPENKSAEFVKSIGNLYLQEGDFHDMMAKKAQYFLYRVRQNLLIDTRNMNEDFIRSLHLKTGKNIDEIREAVELIRKGTDPYARVMREDLVRMDRLLDEILKY